MTLTIHLFAAARQRAGQSAVTIDLPDGATVSQLRSAFAAAHPGLATLLPSSRIAVDSEYAPDDQTIPPGAEIALIPPVSGG